jgi:hypothetical protein
MRRPKSDRSFVLNVGTWRFNHSANFLHYLDLHFSTVCALHRVPVLGSSWKPQTSGMMYNDWRTLAVALGIAEGSPNCQDTV